MTAKLYQWNFEIKGLIPRQVKIRKFWLKKGKLFLERKGGTLDVCLLGDDSDTFNKDQEILPYLKFASLISQNSSSLTGGGGHSLASEKEFGREARRLTTAFSISFPDEAIEEIEKYVPDFLRKLRTIHNKYEKTVKENRFLEIATDYFHDSMSKSVFSDEGFISAMICIEALYNDGGSALKYKVALRAAFLLGLKGFDSTNVFKQLGKLYDIRSTLVHGGGDTEGHNPERDKLTQYARFSIIIFSVLLKSRKRSVLKKKERKKELLREIDYAMVDVSKREALHKEIEKGIRDFAINFPRKFEGKGKNGPYLVYAW